jgi:hypothetical protein
MVEVWKVGRFEAYLERLWFGVAVDDLIEDDGGRGLMQLLKGLGCADVRLSNGRIQVFCDDVEALYVSDARARPGYRLLAIFRLEDGDGVNYFTVLSDPLAPEYVHYHEWVDRNRESQGYLYQDLVEFIFEYEEDSAPELVDGWIKVFSDPRILRRFPELDFIIKRLEEVRGHVCDCW